MATTIIRPDSDITSGSNIHTSDDVDENYYSYINEETLDTGDYLKNTSDGTTALFGFESSGLNESTTINKLTLYQHTSAYGPSCNFYVNDTIYEQDDYSGGVNYLLWKEFINSPFTDEEWTVSEIDSSNFGIYLAGSKSTERCYQYYIEIDYSTETPSEAVKKRKALLGVGK